MCEGLGPVEGWIVKTRDFVGFVKGCTQPLPFLFVTPRLQGGLKIWGRVGGPTQGIFLRKTNCLGGRFASLVLPTKANLLSPVEAVKELRRSCRNSLCQAALELADLLDCNKCVVGVSGGLAYNPNLASDIDIVVYTRNPTKVYGTVKSLRAEGTLAPFIGKGHCWTRRDELLHKMIFLRRVLMGTFKGFEYNIKIVPCLKPLQCSPIRFLGYVTVRGRLIPLTNYTIPASYILEVRDALARALRLPVRLHLVTYRLRFTEIPNAIVEVRAALEKWGDAMVLVPDDGGYISLLEHEAD